MFEELGVVEIGGTVASGAAGDLFRRLGANVTRVDLSLTDSRDDPGTMRTRLLEILGREKRVVRGERPWDEVMLMELAQADVVVVDLSATGNALLESESPTYEEQVGRHNPGSWVTISPFGLHGPRRRFLGTEITNAAAGGFMSYMRTSRGRPMKPAGFTSSITAGHFAGLAALHGILLGKDSGGNVHMDFSIQGSVLATSVFLECSHELFECSPFAGSSRQGPPSGLIQCADGLIWLMVVEDHHWAGFVRALGSPEWADGVNTVKEREQHADQLREGTLQWARQHSAQDAVARLQGEGVPVTVVNSPATLTEDGCPDVRPGFVSGTGGSERLPGLPFSSSAPQRSSSSSESAADRPYRLLEMTNVLAGPLACSWLGAMGVDVLKVEDSTRLDVYRRRGPFPGGVQEFESSAYFAGSNYSKRSYGIALDNPDGLQLLSELMSTADLVVTNLSAHRANKLGVLAHILDKSSDAVLLSSGGFSELAANAAFRCYGLNCHASGGVVYLSRDRDDQPHNPGMPWADPLTSIWIAILAIAQLLLPASEREHLNVSMTEVVAFEFPEFFSALTTDGIEATSMENRVDHAAPHGVYQCAGDDRWLAIACENDEQWQRLVAALGEPPALVDPDLSFLPGRLAAQDSLDDAVEQECQKRERDELFLALQQAGVPSAPVYSAPELVVDEHLRERELFQTVDHAVWGKRALTGLPWRIVGVGAVEISATPLLGADTTDDRSKWWRETRPTYVPR